MPSDLHAPQARTFWREAEDLAGMPLPSLSPTLLVIGMEGCAACEALLDAASGAVSSRPGIVELQAVKMADWRCMDGRRNVLAGREVRIVPSIFLFHEGRVAWRAGGLHTKQGPTDERLIGSVLDRHASRTKADTGP